MRPHLLLLGILVLASPSGAQQSAFQGAGQTPAPWRDVLSRVSGRVNDLNRDANGRVLYCTKEGEIGALDPSQVKGSRRTQLVTGFGLELRAVAIDLAGDAVVVEKEGGLWKLPGNTGALVQVYADLYMISDATDLVVDERGDFFIASKTPSSGTRGTNRVSSDGTTWDYHAVRYSPVQIVADPLSDDLLMADDSGGGAMRAIDGTCTTRPISTLDDTTQPGFDAAADDGDMVCEQDGDVYWIAGGDVWFRDRSMGTTSLFATGYDTLRGVTIAASTLDAPSATGWSLYIAEGAYPTTIRELPGVGAPASEILRDQGGVPGKGVKRLFTAPLALQVIDIAADNDGNILLGGHQYQTNHKIVRYNTTTGMTELVAHQSDGLSGQIQGIVVAPDDSIYALTRQGVIHKITEDPLVVTTVYDDAANQITYGCDLAMDLDGTFYVADRDSWGNGELVAISSGVATTLTTANEARGISADPNGGGLFLTEWNGAGFNGTVNRYDFGADTLTPLPGFDLINYSNGFYDGDTVVDVNGNIYSCSEDDWSVVRYEPGKSGYTRLLSGYTTGGLSGVELAPSTPGSGSTTGWSLYISDYNNLYEVASVAAPASKFVDSTTDGIASSRVTLDPRLGRPRGMTRSGDALFVSTSRSAIVAADPLTGGTRLVADATHGLQGDLVAIAANDAETLAVANDAGAIFLVDARYPERGTRLWVAPNDARLTGPIRDLLFAANGRLVVETGGSDAGLYLVHRARIVRVPMSVRPGFLARLRVDEPFALAGWTIYALQRRENPSAPARGGRRQRR